MNLKVVSLVFLVLFAFAMAVNVVMAANVELPDTVSAPTPFGCNDDPGFQPQGDPVDGPGCPHSKDL